MEKKEKLSKELDSFQKIWKGGFYQGDPLNPTHSPLYALGYIGIPHAIFLTCIKPYVSENTSVLEIGCGRGAYTRTMLSAKEIWCLDALAAEHNGFWEYVGQEAQSKIKYFQVEDFSCSMLPDDHFDYFFSYDALCHVSFEGISEYMKNIHSKLKPGAHGFLMVADYEKYNFFLDHSDRFNVMRGIVDNIKTWLIRWPAQKCANIWGWISKRGMKKQDLSEHTEPVPGRWYHAGTDQTCKMLEACGYTILDKDIGVDYRNPIIHFVK